MSEERKKPGVAFWATVVVTVALSALVLYPLSYGPALWIAVKTGHSNLVWGYGGIYEPIGKYEKYMPDSAKEWVLWYHNWWHTAAYSAHPLS